MWRELWEKHRSKVCAIAGAGLFLTAGTFATLLPFPNEGEGPAQPLPVEEKRDVAPVTAPAAPGAASLGATSPGTMPLGAAPGQRPPSGETHYFYITGGVRHPGVYTLPSGSRLFQLINAAGGFDGLADKEAVNLAEPLQDGAHIHIPRLGGNPTQSGRASPAPGAKAKKNSAKQATKSNGPVDLNRASAEELTRLRGIGPALAKRIVEYRQQRGPFRSVEELINVRGIGAAKLQGMRGQAVVSP